MLKQFSRMEKTRSLVIIIFAVIMGLSLIFFYAPGGRDAASSASAMSREVLARVRGDKITVGDLDEQKAAMRKAGQQLPPGLDRYMLDNLIESRLTVQEAERLGLAPSDAEVNDRIIKQLVDPSTKKFIGADDLERYKNYAVSQAGSIENFERQFREAIAQEKLRAFVTAGVILSEDEVKREWDRSNTAFELVYVPVLTKDLAKTITPAADEIAAYYESHKEDFRINDPQKKIRYLYISTVKMGERLTISDKDLQDDYIALSPEHKVAGVKVQQIVLKDPSKGQDQSVLAKATEIALGLRGEGSVTVSEEKFAEVASGRSEDAATQKNGGRLPNPVKKDPNKRDIYQNVFALEQEGQVSDPFFDRQASAYYIFRRGADVPKTFEMAREELLASKRNRLAYNDGAALAARAVARLRETKDVEAVARELAAQANMKPAEMVKETDYIKPGDNVPDIGSNPQFEGVIAPLNNPQDVGDQIGVRNGFAIPMLVDKRDPRVPSLEEVRSQVTERVREEKATGRLEEAARELAAANNPDELKAVAERFGLEVKTNDNYNIATSLEGLETSVALGDAIYSLGTGGVTKTPVKVGDTWVVAAVKARKDADPVEFAKQSAQLMKTALTTQRNEAYTEYMAALRSRLEREGEVKVNEDVLAKLAALEKPTMAAPRSGGLTVPVGE